MKQKLLYIILMIVALVWSEKGWSQTTSWLIVSSEEKSWTSPNNSGSYTLPDPHGTTLSFDARTESILGFWSKIVHAQYSTDNNNWTDALEATMNNKDTWYTFTATIPAGAKYVRFQSKTGQTGTRRIKNVKVTRATTLSLAPGVSSTLDMGSIRIGKSVSNTIRVAYNNTTYNQNLTGTCTNSFFTVTSKSLGETGEADITINYNPTSAGTHTGTVTLSMAGATASFTVTGIAADKGTPAFTWNVSTAYKNHSYSDFFTSTNTDTNYTITSSNPSLGNVVDGKLVFYDGEGTVVFMVSQEGNDDWNAHSESFSVNVIEAQNHLPLTITSSNHSTLVRSISGSYAWDSDGIRLGDGWGGLNYDDKLAEINFEGIPDKISFDYEKQASGATDVDWYVQVSVDGNDWTKIWSVDNSGSGHADITIENANVRYVRLCYSGNFGGYFRNVTITERRYLTASTNTLDFGTDNIKGNSVAQTFTLSHCNAGYGVTITSSDRNFIATPNPVTTTGGDIMGTETITVQYLNNILGEHSGTITISDPNGSNEDITINVSGTTKTYYYAHAEVECTEGGSAAVSFESFDAATGTSDNKTFGPTTASAPKTNIYFKAVAFDDYEFVGWKTALTDASYFSSDANYTISNFTYSSEDSSNPSTKALVAVFRKVVLSLEPSAPNYLPETYQTITLHRTLLRGYNTIALPFATNVVELTGRTSSDDWVAQLSAVTYNQHDGYTMFFQKVSNGAIAAMKPYVLYLGAQVVNPSWTNITLAEAQPVTITPEKGYSGYADWQMSSNFTAGMNMQGKYGIVNSAGGLKLGGSGSTLNAFTAYITPPEGVAGVKVRSAFVDEWGNATFIHDIDLSQPSDPQASEMYSLGGLRLTRPTKGVHIVRDADGHCRKVIF